MAKTVEKTKLVTVSNKGPIDELGGISGPIINPCKLPESIVIKMVTKRVKK